MLGCAFLNVFHTIVSWWFFTGVWVTTSPLKSLGLFLVFWPILIRLPFGWSPLVLFYPSPLVRLSIIWWLYRPHHLQFVIPSLSCAIVCFFPVLLALAIPLSFFSLSFSFTLWSARTLKSTIQQVLSFFIDCHLMCLSGWD